MKITFYKLTEAKAIAEEKNLHALAQLIRKLEKFLSFSRGPRLFTIIASIYEFQITLRMPARASSRADTQSPKRPL